MKRNMYAQFLVILLGIMGVVASGAIDTDEAMKGLHLVAKDNCGVDGQQGHHVTGANWYNPESKIGLDVVGADDPARTNVYDKKIQYKYTGLDPKEKYKFRFIYLSDNDRRTIRVKADGVVIDDKVRLPFLKLVTRIVELPKETYADGKVVLEFTQVSGTSSDAIVSAIELWSTAETLVPFLDVSVSVKDVLIDGVVSDENKGDVSRTKISLAIKGTSWKKKVTSDKAGNFSAKLPGNWVKYVGRKLVVTATKGRAKGIAVATLKEVIDFEAEFTHGPQRPSSIPILPGLNIGWSFFLTDSGVFNGAGANNTGGPYYESADEDSFGIHNGPGSYHYKISVGDTSGGFYLYAGDRPNFSIVTQPPSGGYAYPVLIPDIGAGGQVRLAVTSNGRTKWLDEFSTVDGVLQAGEVKWTCKDEELDAEIEMTLNPFIKVYGCAATAKVISGEPVELNWSYEWSGNIEIKDGYAMVKHRKYKYTQVYVGTESGSAKVTKEGSSARLAENIAGGSESKFVCVWGYTDYNRQEVTNAFNRLRYKPFPDQEWVENMKKEWFENWFGMCFEPEVKFIQARDDVDGYVGESVKFWDKQRSRMRIKTPDSRFDTVVNNVSANLFLLYQYPVFLHGLNYMKIGKIGCGYYGLEQAGLHDEVADSLEHLTGNMCLKGRMRYWSPVFMISGWSEEQDFYFVEQVWHHYRWTGDKEYVKTMWPSVRRAMEHGLAACDPDGDGIMTAYYEHWGCDGHTRGGKAIMFTSLARSALRGAVEMAKIAGDYDTQTGYQGAANEDTPTVRLQGLLDRIEKHKDKPFWIKEAGAWGSAENNGDIRPHPEPMEQNYCIWRGWGEKDPMKRYMAMRYIRENLQLNTAPGVTMELKNDYWPIIWDHHGVFNGDSSMSVLCAAKSGDIDNYWPSFKSIAESAYKNDDATLFMTFFNDGMGTDIGQTLELQPQFIQAVVSGLFGAEPYFGDNLLELSPSLPSDWDYAEISTTDFAYEYKKDDSSVRMHLTTPVDRIIKAKLPVKGKIQSVTLNGQPVDYSIERAVNVSRVVIETKPGREFDFEVKTASPAIVEGNELVFIGERAEFAVKNAEVVKVIDPQEKMSQTSINSSGDTASIVPGALGKYTVFLELQAGGARWLHALDLDVRNRWTLTEKFITAFNPGGPSVASPKVDENTKTLTLQIENNSDSTIKDKAVITVAGKQFKQKVDIAANAAETLTVSLDKVWSKLSPGSIPVQVQLAGDTQIKNAVNWEIGKDKGLKFASRLKPLDLNPYYNIDISYLYSLDFNWRIDYTGCGIGIDWRTKMPNVDDKGYVLMSPPTAMYSYLNLEEGYSSDWRSWNLPAFDGPLGDAEIGVGFDTGGKPVKGGAKGNILALLSNEPYDRLPSEVIISLKKPLRLEKIYLLTANLTKSVKCYYPGAEVVVHYTSGKEQTEILVPPYTMGNMLYPVSPLLYHIEFGSIGGLAVDNPSKTG